MNAYRSPNFEVERLADGVFACIHKIGGRAISNAGIIDNGRETIVFDCFLDPDTAQELPQVVGYYGLSPVKYVINSHGHNDHIRGNQVFGPEVTIISTAETREIIEKWEAPQIAYERDNAGAQVAVYEALQKNFTGNKDSLEYREILIWLPYYRILEESHRRVITRLPDRTFDGTLELNGPKRKVKLIAMGSGHSQSDSILLLPREGIGFMADLVFNGCHPYLGDGNPSNWRSILSQIQVMNLKTLVPGHGPVGDSSLLSTMTDYLDDLFRLAHRITDEGMSVEAVSSEYLTEAYARWHFRRFFEANLHFMVKYVAG